MLNVAKRLLDESFQFEFHLGGTGNSELIDHFNLENNTGNSIFYFPSIPYEKVPEKMREFDCFVLFSNYENQPCVQGESFACGLPFIGTDVGGIKEFLPDKFGFLIEKQNEAELYLAMKKVLKNYPFASKNEMNQYAVNHFSTQKISEKFNAVYNQILKND
jgi:glycosyltransferase involved in cell wall biosynthesis